MKLCWILVLLPALALSHMMGGRAQRGKLGAPSEVKHISQASEEAEVALQYAVSSTPSSSDLCYKLGSDMSHTMYTEQLTAGMTYRFYNVPLKTSTCRNQDNVDCATHPNSSKCGVSTKGRKAMQKCDFKVQWQAWEDPAYTLLSLSCS